MLIAQIVIAAALALVGVGLSLFVLDALRIVMRIHRDKTLMVAELAPGPAELVGELRAAEPILAFDGSRAAAVRRTVHCKFKSGDDSHEYAIITHSEGSRVELSDASGACLLELNKTMFLGHEKHYVFKPEDFRARFPELWSKVAHLRAAETAEEVIAEEIAVPDGARAFVSGEAALDEPPKGERRKPRYKLRGGPHRPLIVSSWDEKAVISALLRPAVRVAWLALLCWIVAAIAIAIPIVLTARAGL